MTAKEARLRKHACRERARRRRAKPGTQLELGIPETFTWGGHREGAGRPPGPRPRTRHEPREPFAAWAPEHLTIRLAGGLPALDDELLFLIFAGGVDAVHRRRLLSVNAYSLQVDHAHLIVEADSAVELSRGMAELGRHLAWGINDLIGRRGPVLDGRFHARRMSSPSQVRNTLQYLVENAARHAQKAGLWTPRAVRDPFTSLGQIDLGQHRAWGERAVGPTITMPPRTWLLRTGWRLA